MTLRVINFADGFTSDNVPVADAIQAHIDNPTDAHDASAISYDNTDSELVADDIQAAIDEVESRLDTAETNISNHINNATDAHDASAISYVNTTSGLAAINAQAAIDEVEGRLGTAESDIQAIEDSIGQANGIAPLNGSSKIDATYLPSYVDDVLEYADIASLPLVGEQGKIYVTIDTNKTYRWTGSIYVEISASPVTSVNSQTGVVTLDADDIAETATRYWSKKNNVANSMPLVTNDSSQNYSVGSQWYDAINDTLYICEDATIGAAVWQPISGAGGGVGSVDIMFADTFENTDIADYTITQPLASISAVSPLQGENSLLIAHDFNPSYYIERIIPVDNKFKNKNVTFTLDVFSNAASGDLTLSVWDHTNTVQLLNSELIQPQDVDQTSAKRSFSFNIPSGANELRYRINVLFDSGKVSRVDNLVIELTQMSKLDTTIEVPVMTEYIDYGAIDIRATTTNPTKGTIVHDKFHARRSGSQLDVRVDFHQSTAGTAGSGTYYIQLPNSLQVDVAKIPTSAATNGIVGFGILTESGGVERHIAFRAEDDNPSRIYIELVTTSGANLQYSYNPLASSFLPLSTALLSFSGNFSVPILGWEATETQSVSLAQTVLVQESDSQMTWQGFAGRGSTRTRVAYFTNARSMEGSAISWTSDTTNGLEVTILEDGHYDIDLHVPSNVSSTSFVGVGKNLTDFTTALSGRTTDNTVLKIANQTSDVSTRITANVSWSGPLKAGDKIYPMSDLTPTEIPANTYFSVSKSGALKQVNASENQKIEIPTSELRMEGASTRGTGSDAGIVRFDNIAKLRGDAFTIESTAALGTVITMKKKGKLDVSFSLALSVAGNIASISINQSDRTALPTASETITSYQVYANNARSAASGEVFVDIGDKVRIFSNGTPTATALNKLNITFQEQEVSVSVTNVLPQFSESDSSVRVDTANGYGSTFTRVRRFSNTRDYLGSAIEYVPSAVNGDRFLIKESGIYNISHGDSFNVANDFCIAKNVTDPNWTQGTVPVQLKLSHSTVSGAFEGTTASWEGYLQSGDFVVGLSNGVAVGTADRVNFTISKVGKPNVTGVDVTPFAKIEYEVVDEFHANKGATGAGVVTGYTITKNTNNGLFSFNNSTGVMTFLKRCRVNISASNFSNTGGSYITINASGMVATMTDRESGTFGFNSVSDVLTRNVGNTISISIPEIGASTVTLRVLATELRDAYQVIGGGVENTYSARINNNGTATIASQSYPFIQSVTRTALGIVTINLIPSFFSETPSVSAITVLGQDVRINSSSNSTIVVNTFNTANFSDADANFNIIVQRQGSDYRTPSKAIGLPAQRIAYIKDVKAAGTAGGTFTSGSWQTRTLNNLVDPSGVVTSLASNQFTLSAGTYDIYAQAPAFIVNSHKLKLRNITDSSDAIIGDTHSAQAAYNGCGISTLIGRVTITASKTFELQHQCQTTRATDGLGPVLNFSVEEVFAQIRITKVEE